MNLKNQIINILLEDSDNINMLDNNDDMNHTYENNDEMTLDDAIDHLKEKIKEQATNPDCNDKCRKEHKQLLIWLLELKKYRELGL